MTRALRKRYGHVNLSDESRNYMVRFVHKISPSNADAAGPIRLNSVDLRSKTLLAMALRDKTLRSLTFSGNGLGGARTVRDFRVESDGRVVIFPSKSIWHSIVLTPVIE
jgi:hypothetical protein